MAKNLVKDGKRGRKAVPVRGASPKEVEKRLSVMAFALEAVAWEKRCGAFLMSGAVIAFSDAASSDGPRAAKEVALFEKLVTAIGYTVAGFGSTDQKQGCTWVMALKPPGEGDGVVPDGLDETVVRGLLEYARGRVLGMVQATIT